MYYETRSDELKQRAKQYYEQNKGELKAKRELKKKVIEIRLAKKTEPIILLRSVTLAKRHIPRYKPIK